MSFFESPAFPLIPVLGVSGGPEFRTEVVSVRSGFEVRNANWSRERRRFNGAMGAKTIQDIEQLSAFFRTMLGRAHGFRLKDWTDYKSSPLIAKITNVDQIIGTGDGVNRVFQLVKNYISGAQSYPYPIKKPVAGTVIIAVNGITNTLWTIDTTTGVVTFNVGQAPAAAATVTAGYEYDVPCRFDTDYLDVQYIMQTVGQTNVPIVELRL